MAKMRKSAPWRWAPTTTLPSLSECANWWPACALPCAASTLRCAPRKSPIEIGEIRLVPARRSVTKRGQPIHLTRKEFDILHCLMSRAGRVVTYARLLTAVWGADCREEVEYLRTFVRQLRKKIEDDPARPLYLLTDIYVGYRFADAQMLEEAQAIANEASEGFASSASPETFRVTRTQRSSATRDVVRGSSFRVTPDRWALSQLSQPPQRHFSALLR